MLKKTICTIMAFLILLLVFYLISLDKKVNNTFELPSEIEKAILMDSSQNENKNIENIKKSKYLNDLLLNAEWIEVNPYVDIKKIKMKNQIWSISQEKGVKVSNFISKDIDGYNYGKHNVFGGFFLNITTLEWGGALYFYPDGDIQQKYCILEGYIWDVYQMGNKYFALATYPFKEHKNSKILELRKTGKQWYSKEVASINDIPCSFTIVNDNTMYVATHSKLIKLVNNKIEEIIIDNAFWKGLYPNSILYEDGTIYVGMQGGVSKIDLSTRAVQFFTPDSE